MTVRRLDLPPGARCPVSTTALRLFGVPPDLEQVLELLDGPVSPAERRPEIELRIAYDELRAITRHLHRWDMSMVEFIAGGPFLPADVPTLRHYTAAGSVGSLALVNQPEADELSPAEHRRIYDIAVRLGTWILDAPPFLIPDAVAPTLVEGHALDDDLVQALRLPFPRVTLWFATPMSIDVDRLGMRLAQAPLRTSQNTTFLHWAVPYARAAMGLGVADSASVVGLALSTGPNGGLADEFCWLLYSHISRFEPRGAFAPLPARLSRCPLADLVLLAAAALAWGHWWHRNDLPDATGKALRRHLRDPGTRRTARAGTLNPGVHVLDLGRTLRGPAGSDEVPEARARGPATGRSVSPHVRRAHYRRTRVGPRHDWHYVGHLIAPTMVNGQAPFDPGRVYRLPVPQAALHLPPLDELADGGPAQ